MSTPKPALNLPFYSRFTHDDLRKLVELKAWVAEDVRSWLAPVCSFISARTFEIIPEIVCFGAPWSGAEELTTSARYSIWLCWLDYFLDEVDGRTSESLRDLQDAVQAGLDSTPAPKEELRPMARALSELCERMARSPAANFLPLLKSTLIREVEACRRQFEMGVAVASGKAAPTPEEFLAESSWSVLSTSASIAFLIALGEPIPPGYEARVLHALTTASVALRLANDLRTYSKDVLEGTLNILDLGPSPQQVREWIQREMDAFDEEMAALRQELAPTRTMEALQNRAHLARDCYHVADMRY